MTTINFSFRIKTFKFIKRVKHLFMATFKNSATPQGKKSISGKNHIFIFEIISYVTTGMAWNKNYFKI